MNHRDLEITEVIVVIKEAFASKLKEAVAKLATMGLEVYSMDESEGVVNGCIETYKLPQLEKMDCVSYVRSVDTYIADFPVGDPRDTDLAGDEEEGEAV